MSGDGAWSAQVSTLLTSSFMPLSPFVQSTLPQGGTLLGVVLSPDKTVRGTAWYSLATRGLVMGGGVGGRVGRMVCCNSYSNC